MSVPNNMTAVCVCVCRFYHLVHVVVKKPPALLWGLLLSDWPVRGHVVTHGQSECSVVARAEETGPLTAIPKVTPLLPAPSLSPDWLSRVKLTFSFFPEL